MKMVYGNYKKMIDECSDTDIFDDSTFAANFEHSLFRDNSLNNSVNSHNVSSKVISDFDNVAGKTWIYPTNYPIRDYQFNIIKAAISKNTLVSLPTGLGKTFIAAVIMYNFYRWYPNGKIIFTAPTKPLVAQQISACYNIVAIPPNDTVEMTGHMQANTRKAQWETKRVFFATPQVIYNDIKSGICPGKDIRCLVIDEAHRAKGNYAYCQIISSLNEIGHKFYRVLALSATPGSKIEDVVIIIKNLNIAHLELRTDTSADVVPYCYTRNINTIIVDLGSEITKLRQQYVEILDVYARNLKRLNILPQNVGNLSKGRIIMMYKEFQSSRRDARHLQHKYIMKDFTFLIALYHGLELLVKHGSRVFLNFFDEHPEKSWIQSDQKLTSFLEKLRSDLRVNPLSLNTSILPDGTIPEIPKNITFGHPKFDKLKEIMLQHFNDAKQRGEETKAIVFCEYRESVNLVHCLLLQCRPLIVPQLFVGQGTSAGGARGSARAQAAAVRAFRAGAANALVATCVAEEGLDVGRVDLILCFDVSTRSPVRLVQRCGRTGRSRDGHVYILVTEGREHQVLLDSMRQRDGLSISVLNSKEVQSSLFKQNPRMLPPGPFPDCNKMFIKVDKSPKAKSDKSKKGQKDLRTMLLENSSNKNNEVLSKADFEMLFPTGFRGCEFFSKPSYSWVMNTNSFSGKESSLIDMTSLFEHQRALHPTVEIGHSHDTNIMVKVLNYNSAKKHTASYFEPPALTQESLTPNVFESPKKRNQSKKKKLLHKSPGKKDGDIRAMFSTATKSTTSYTKVINELGISNDESIPTKIINLFVDLNVENKNFRKTCWLCLNVCSCSVIQSIRNNRDVLPVSIPTHSPPNLPDISLMDNFDASAFLDFANIPSKHHLDYDTDDRNCNKPEDNFDSELQVVQYETNNNKSDKKAELDFDLDDIEDIFANDSDKAVESEVDCKSLLSVINENNNNVQITKSLDSVEKTCLKSNKPQPAESDNRTGPKDKEMDLDLIDMEDIFADSSLESTSENNALEYFKLNSITDIFADSDSESTGNAEENCKPTNEFTKSEEINEFHDKNEIKVPTHPTSPSILSGRSVKNNSIPSSPILSSQTRKFNLSIKKNTNSSTPKSAKKQLDMSKPPSLKQTRESTGTINLQNISSNSMLTISQTLDFINRTNNDSTVSRKSHNTGNDSRVNDERSSSPILLTQRDRRNHSNTKDSLALEQQKATPKKQQLTSIFIIDSDSDSDFEISTLTQKCRDRNKNSQVTRQNDSPVRLKLGTDGKCENSPYFDEESKTTDSRPEANTLQKKILSALTSTNFNRDTFGGSNSHVNYLINSPIFPGKENRNITFISDQDKTDCYKNNLSKLQMYRRDSDYPKINNFPNVSTKMSTPANRVKRKMAFSDSDDDFDEPRKKRAAATDRAHITQPVNHKVRKKKRKRNNSLVDWEAEQSGEGTSGDELSEDSAGSIAEFICDDSAVHDHPRMLSLYLKSIKSPVKDVFKIPNLSSNFNKRDIMSQNLIENDDDTYEMDSFCVDSHVGLTQANEMSELDVAEMILEERRKEKRSQKRLQSQPHIDSPLFRRKKRINKHIESDSDESS